jgi:hypothetical protein
MDDHSWLLNDKLGVRILATNLLSGFPRQTCCPDFRDKLAVRISATNLLSGDKLSRTSGTPRIGEVRLDWDATYR